jgi:hypothetical protein
MMRNVNVNEPQNQQSCQTSVSSCVFTCICPSGLEYTKDHVRAMKEWQKIVMNYLKIKRLYKTINQ